jgi:hypothetical protein
VGRGGRRWATAGGGVGGVMAWALALFVLWLAGSVLAVAFFHGCRILDERSRGMR